MRNLIIVCALMFSALTFGQMSFSIANLDLGNPMGSDEDANIGWFMTDDILVSFGMENWDDFSIGARYYTGMMGNMFVEANTTASQIMEDPNNTPNDETDDVGTGESSYVIGARVGWTKALGIWKLQFEPMIVLDDVQDFTPRLAWGLRFNL
tara:strand:+ start:661 stop:1116 length:456 start_codon:yes stop_codon:yes gene_type:complete